MPLASKTSVFTSDSAPWAGTSLPFQTNETAAALPSLTVISRVARTVVLAGAIRVSWLTSCPSAWTEIQEFSVARMTSVIVGAGLVAVAAFAGMRTVTSFSTGVFPAGDVEWVASVDGTCAAGCLGAGAFVRDAAAGVGAKDADVAAGD